MESAYRTLIKVLLGVRPTTTINLCLVELGMPSLGARVKAAQRKFVLRQLAQREEIADDPFMQIWEMCVAARTKGAKYLEQLIVIKDDIIQTDIANRKRGNVGHQGTKSNTYFTMNPNGDRKSVV